MKHDDALRTYAELLAKDPAGLFANAARYERGLTAYKAGKFADAAAMAQEIPLTDNLRKDAYWLLAESFAAMGKSDSAIQYYRLLAKEFPDSDVYRDACYRLAHHLQAKGEYAEASQYYLAVADRFPDHDLAPKALYGSAYALTKAARYEDAVRDWTRLARTYAGHELREEALYQKAMGEVRLGRKPDAAEALRSLLKDYPASGYAADAHYWQGVLLKEAGSLQDAAESLRLCLKAEPRKELAREAAFCLASVLQASGQAGEAAALFQSLVDSPLKDRFSPGLLEWMSTQHYDKGDYTNAVAAARLMVESASDAAWRQTGWCLAGRGLLASGDAAGAKAAFEASLAADAATPFAPEASLRLGEIALGAGDAAGATARFSRAAELAVDETLLGVRARAYAGLARSAKAGGDLDSAARYFMSVAVLFEDRDLVPECLYEAAQAYLQLANGGAAQKAVEELKARYPDSEWTKRAGVP